MTLRRGESAVGGVRNKVGGRFEDSVAAWFAVHILVDARAVPRWGLASATTLLRMQLQAVGNLDDMQVRCYSRSR